MKNKYYLKWLKLLIIFFIIFVGCYYIVFWCSNRTPLVLSENEPEKLVLLKGKLILKLFPGPPEYSSIKDGDRKDYCWLLKLDKSSFKIAMTTRVCEPANSKKNIMEHSDPEEISLCLDDIFRKYCQDHINQNIECEGYLFHAHTIHHYTPIILDVKKIGQNGTLVGQ